MLRVSFSHRDGRPTLSQGWDDIKDSATLWTTPRAPSIPAVEHPHLSQITSIHAKAADVFTSSKDGTIRKWSLPPEVYDSKVGSDLPLSPSYILAANNKRVNDFVVLGSGVEGSSFAYDNGLKRDIIISVSDDEYVRVYQVYSDFCALDDDENILTDPGKYIDLPRNIKGKSRVKFRAFDEAEPPPVFGPCSTTKAHGDIIKALGSASTAEEKTVKNLKARFFVTGSLDGHVALFDAISLKVSGLCCGWCLGRCQICVQEALVQDALVRRWPQLSQGKTWSSSDSTAPELVPVSRVRARNYTAGTSGVFAVELMETSPRVAAGLGDGTVMLWDTRTKKSKVETKHAHADVVRAIRVIGNRMVTASSDCSVAVWDLRAISDTPLVTLDHHVDSVMCLHLDKEASTERQATLLSGGRDGLAFSFSVDDYQSTNKRVGVSDVAVVGVHSSGVSAIAQNGPVVFTGCEDGLITCWIPDEKTEVSRPLTNAFLNGARLRGERCDEFSRIVGIRRTHSPLVSLTPPPMVVENVALGSQIHQILKFSDGKRNLRNILSNCSLAERPAEEREIRTQEFFHESISGGQMEMELLDWKNGITDWFTYSEGHEGRMSLNEIPSNKLVHIGLLILLSIFREDLSDLSDEMRLQLSLLDANNWWITLSHESSSVSAWLPQLPSCVGSKERLIDLLSKDTAEAIRRPLAYRPPQSAHGFTVQLRPRKNGGLPEVRRDIITLSRFSSPPALANFIARELRNEVTIKDPSEITIYEDDQPLSKDLRFGSIEKRTGLLVLEYSRR